MILTQLCIIISNVIDWLIDWIEIYAVSAMFQPCNGGYISNVRPPKKTEKQWKETFVFINNKKNLFTCWKCVEIFCLFMYINVTFVFSSLYIDLFSRIYFLTLKLPTLNFDLIMNTTVAQNMKRLWPYNNDVIFKYFV